MAANEEKSCLNVERLRGRGFKIAGVKWTRMSRHSQTKVEETTYTSQLDNQALILSAAPKPSETANGHSSAQHRSLAVTAGASGHSRRRHFGHSSSDSVGS